ncbi:hypothetical protein DL93DRAFT_811522 [Clavulina sp. PMI_390]|nr:hypothetical protein DL93DRAFT_811522 [Clavulina sp. PMI_390]
MELALQVVGLKMTGRIEEAKDVAMRIVGTSSSSGDGGDAGVAGGSMSTYTTLSGSAVDGDVVHTALHGADSQASGSSTRDFQSVIIEFLKLLDVEVPTTSRVTVEEAVSLASPSGQTLLHLSAILGFHRLLKHLVSRGIDLDVRDANGYTALHFAALCGRVACARILVEGGADIEIVDARGRLAREVAQWRDQVDVQDLLESFEHRAARSDATTGSDDADESELGDDSEYMSSAEDSDDWNVASPTATIKPEPVEVEDDFNLSDHEDVADGNEPAAPVRPITGPEDSKFPPEKSLLSTSEKNPQSLLHRTLSQLPTAGLPNLPPMPDFFPNMPGLPMPQWALPNQLQLPNLHLPDIPLVFPVQMPTPSWPAVLQWSQPSTPTAGDAAKRSEGGFAVLPSGALPSWLSSYPWLAASGASTPSAEKEQDPPMYTPPAPSTSSVPLAVPLQSASTSSESIPREEAILPAGTESGSGVITSLSRAGSSSMLHSRPKSSRRQAHTAAEREQRLHDFQIKLKKQEQDKLKSKSQHYSRIARSNHVALFFSTSGDRMLIFFWIPVLILVFVYGVYVGVPALISGARNAADAYHTLRKQLTPA